VCIDARLNEIEKISPSLQLPQLNRQKQQQQQQQKISQLEPVDRALTDLMSAAAGNAPSVAPVHWMAWL
jgi:hypothetical protein